MNNEQKTPKSNGKLSLILNDDFPTPTTPISTQTPTTVTGGQESSPEIQNDKEITTTNGSGKTSKIKKEFKYPHPPKEASPSKNEGSTSSKVTAKPATKSSKQSKTSAASSKSKPSKNSKSSRKRPLSPSDSEEGRETSQELERCHHPKHDEYKNKFSSVINNNKRTKLDKPQKLVGMPKRLEGVLNIDRGTKMCSRCINQTDKDPQYTTHKKYVSRKSVYKKNERSRLTIDMNGK